MSCIAPVYIKKFKYVDHYMMKLKLILLLKAGSLYNAIPGSNLIGLAAMVYQLLYHAQEIATIKIVFWLS